MTYTNGGKNTITAAFRFVRLPLYFKYSFKNHLLNYPMQEKSFSGYLRELNCSLYPLK